MSYNYETRTITHNTEKGFFAPINSNAASGKVEFGKPLEYTGLQAVKIETKQDYEDKYADGRVHVSVAGAEQVTGEIGSLQIREEFWNTALGKKIVSVGGSSSKAKSLLNTGKKQAFVFGFAEILTDEFNNESIQWTIVTNAKASVPTKEAATDEDKVSEVQFTVPVTMSVNSAVLDADGLAVREITVTDDAEGTVSKLVDSMFGTAPTVTVEDLLNTLVGKTPEVDPGEGK